MCLQAICILSLDLRLYIYWVILNDCGNLMRLSFGYLQIKQPSWVICLSGKLERCGNLLVYHPAICIESHRIEYHANRRC